MRGWIGNDLPLTKQHRTADPDRNLIACGTAERDRSPAIAPAEPYFRVSCEIRPGLALARCLPALSSV
jgi:hypothetical protein